MVYIENQLIYFCLMIAFIYKSSQGYHKKNFTSLVIGTADRIEEKKHSALVAMFDHNYGIAIYKSKDFEQCQRDLQQKLMSGFPVMGAYKLQLENS